MQKYVNILFSSYRNCFFAINVRGYVNLTIDQQCHLTDF